MDKVGELYLTDKKSFDGYTFVKGNAYWWSDSCNNIYTKVVTGDVEVIPPRTEVNQPFQSQEEKKISSVNYCRKEEKEFI